MKQPKGNISKLKMAPLGDYLLCKSPTRSQLTFMRTCAVTVLGGLLLYTFTYMDIKATVQSVEAWKCSKYLQNAVNKLQSVISIPKRERKLVLLWTALFRKNDWLPSTATLKCPVSDCDVTSNRSLLLNSSAVILHWLNTDVHNLPDCVPSNGTRCPHWVLFNNEPPYHTPRHILEAIQSNVQWTATYRRDSDLYAPYGSFEPRKESNYEKPEFDGNRRLLCWLVSHCKTQSKRELFVSDLRHYIEVDTYGRCSDLKCPHKYRKECYQWLSKRCKFYLAFENSNCKDYITEKLYFALSSGMVPVVLGNNSNYDILPPRSYINAADFSGPKELAEYLVTVGENKDLYFSYFWWRKNYEVIDTPFKWLCELCEKLHDDSIRSRNSRKNLTSWWYQSVCAK